jgi:hypothetical protein
MFGLHDDLTSSWPEHKSHDGVRRLLLAKFVQNRADVKAKASLSFFSGNNRVDLRRGFSGFMDTCRLGNPIFVQKYALYAMAGLAIELLKSFTQSGFEVRSKQFPARYLQRRRGMADIGKFEGAVYESYIPKDDRFFRKNNP